METPDLNVVDQAFGVFADLYSDILRVSVAATHEQIQLAYFDRRSELFTLLAKLDSEKNPTEESTEQRLAAERKMDAVVLAVRVLGDMDSRLWYDQQRQERLMNRRRAAHGQLPGQKSPERSARGGSSLDSVCMEEEHQDRDRSTSRRRKSRSEQLKPQAHAHSKKSKKKASGRPNNSNNNNKERSSMSISSSSDKNQHTEPQQQQESNDTSLRSKDTVDTEHMTDDDSSGRGRHGTRTTASKTPPRAREERQDTDDGEGSCGTDFDGASLVAPSDKEPVKGKHMLSVITNSRVLKNITEEISGACEDALTSVDQVFNAFTLTDKDITAVLKRIDRAKAQFDH